MGASDVQIVAGRQDPLGTGRLLRALPEWFGVEDAVVAYVEAARSLPTVLAVRDGSTVGVLMWKRHFPASAEIHLMAVDPAYHRRGIGRQLLDVAEAELRHDGVRFLQVKTLGPSRPEDGYALTRLFYQACGFVPLEEMLDVWPDNPMLILVKSLG